MTIRPIITAPDPRLKLRSEVIAEVDDGVRQLLDDMYETMVAAPGIGLAAVQIGEPRAAIAVCLDTPEGEEPRPYYLVNPEVVWRSDEEMQHEEGCLSLPEQFAEVVRPAEARIRYLDYRGEEQELHAAGLLARCILHEMDHLRGVLFVDHLTVIKRNIILRKLAKARRQQASA